METSCLGFTVLKVAQDGELRRRASKVSFRVSPGGILQVATEAAMVNGIRIRNREPTAVNSAGLTEIESPNPPESAS